MSKRKAEKQISPSMDACSVLPGLEPDQIDHLVAFFGKLELQELQATIDTDVTLKDILYKLPPSGCTRAATIAATIAARNEQAQAGMDVVESGKMTGGELTDDQKKKFKRLLAWLLAISTSGGVLVTGYNSGIAGNAFRWLVMNTWLGGQLNGVVDIFNNILGNCGTVEGAATQFVASKGVKAAAAAASGHINIPDAFTATINAATMTCGDAHIALEGVFKSIETAVELKQTQLAAAAGTAGVLGWLTGQTGNLTSYITQYIDFYEAILDKLLEGFDWTAGASVSVTVAAFKYLKAKKPAEIKAVVRTIPALQRRSASAGYLSVPGPGGKKTNKRRKQSKRKPKRKSKRTSKRRSKK
jgi:hypothetical protein